MDVFRKQVRGVLRSTTLRLPLAFYWFGRKNAIVPGPVRERLTEAQARDYLLYDIQATLYGSWYTQGLAVASPPPTPAVALRGRTPFASILSEANQGQGSSESGWTVHRVEHDVAVIGKGGVVLRAHVADCIRPAGQPLDSGMVVRLRMQKDLFGMSPGFYMALGDSELIDDGVEPLIRIYMNVIPDGAAALVETLTGGLNAAGVAFRLKVLNEPAVLLTRCDPAVLYVSASDRFQTFEVLRDAWPEISNRVRPRIPTLTLPVAPGIGLAEDTRTVDSFGMDRCLLLAEGLIEAAEQGAKSAEDRLAIIERRFDASGVSLDRPYVQGGSSRQYSSLMAEYEFPDSHGLRQPLSSRRRTEAEWIEVAALIGKELVSSSIWSQGRCTWVGAEPVDDARGGVAVFPFATLGPDLYSGTSGVAWFLAELHAVTGAPDVRATALGAIEHALASARRMQPPLRSGLFNGALGVALVAERVGALLDDPELSHRARRLLRYSIRVPRSGQEWDLLSGHAGSILGILMSASPQQDEEAMETASRFGRRLVRGSTAFGTAKGWASNLPGGARYLTGYSHGVAGIAHALAELSSATGDEALRRDAIAALGYERALFDATVGNWPDLREVAVRPPRIPSTAKLPSHEFGTYWCHGAPGIAISRLRTYELWGDELSLEEALIALNATREMVLSALDARSSNYSLCHGLAGNAEVLAYGEEVLGDSASPGVEIARQVGAEGCALYCSGSQGWPCGTGHGSAPGMMLGIAGIGMFYLRLHSPVTPTPLLLDPGRLHWVEGLARGKS
jgi:hypothetical protein